MSQLPLVIPSLEQSMADNLEQLLQQYAAIRSDYRADRINVTTYHERIAVALREAYNKHEERIMTAPRKTAVLTADMPELEFHVDTFRVVGPACEEYADLTDD